MLKYPKISPTLFSIGPFHIRWYGLLYIISFIIGYIFIKKFYQQKKIEISKTDYDNLLFDVMLGVVLGGRIGYILFYNLPYYINNPLKMFAVWEGGMSFHGGALGVIIAGLIFAKRHKFSFYELADPAMGWVAIGLGLGRLGNFINGELYGRATNVPWAMIFPDDPKQIPRHPSQLYEFLLEGIVLSSICFYLLKKNVKEGIIFWSFIGFYGIFRIFIEFFRQPDPQLGFILFNRFTMGQLLSSLMILSAIVGIVFISKKK